jgi:hypothetical protein
MAGAKILLRRALAGSESFDTTFLASSDTAGRFQFEKLQAGRYVIEASYQFDTLPPTVLDLARRERLDVELMVGRAEIDPQVTLLPTLTVAAAPPPRSMALRDDIESRRRMGLGQFITREAIQQRNPSTLADVLRMATGVELLCRRGECIPRMVRARPGCLPAVRVDGSQADVRILNAIAPNDLHAVEIYLGLSEAPLEIGGPAPCGLIVIWTRLNSDERRTKQPAGSATP